MTSSSSPVNISQAEQAAYLSSLQDVTTTSMIPAMIMLITFSCVGMVGNSLVLTVYSGRFTRTCTRIFIMSIAGFDLVANVLVIPGEIYDMFHIWDFRQPNFCRVRMFSSAFTTISASLILLGVAVVRFRKVCRPFGWQITIPQGKVICASIALFSCLSAVPYSVISGEQTKATPRAGIVGHECTTDDSYKDTIWPLVNTGFFLLLFLFSCVPLVVMYAMIGRQAWKHRTVYGAASGARTTMDGKLANASTTDSVGQSQSQCSDSVATRSTNQSLDSAQADKQRSAGSSPNLSIRKDGRSELKSSDSMPREDATIGMIELTENPVSTQSVTFSKAVCCEHGQVVEKSPNDDNSLLVTGSSSARATDTKEDEIKDDGKSVQSEGVTAKQPIKRFKVSTKTSVTLVVAKRFKASRQSTQRRGIGRTTTMLLVITVVYILSLVPHLVCMFFKFLDPEGYIEMNVAEMSVYNVFLRMYFLNSAANPVIYSLWDVKFRQQCRALFSCC